MAGTITTHSVLERLGHSIPIPASLPSLKPGDGSELGRVRLASADDYERTVAKSIEVFERWRMFPAPKRGQIVREIGDELRRSKTISARWSRSKWARSWPKARAKCRR
jgi:acyl-CoA reductase-like NAD-dependent aldehyde dehydrogenase